MSSPLPSPPRSGKHSCTNRPAIALCAGIIAALCLAGCGGPPSGTSLEIKVQPPASGPADAVLADAVRQIREAAAAGNLPSATIRLAPGDYPLENTWEISRATLGKFAGELLITGEPGAVLSGSEEVSGWSLADHPDLPPAARGRVWAASWPSGLWPKTLYDGTGMLPRSRSRGFLPDEQGTLTTFSYPSDLLPADAQVEGLELAVRPTFIWCWNVLPVVSLDPTTGRGTTALPATYPIGPLKAWGAVGPAINEAAWLENHPAFISQPGHWAVDPVEGKIYLWPRGEGQPAGIRAARLIELVRIEGDEAAEKPLTDVTVRDLTFTQADRESIGAEDAGLQHDWDFLDKGNAMLRLRWVENITVDNCRFVESGASGLRADLHAQNVRVQGNLFRGLGGGGILFCGYGPGTKDLNKNNVIHGNLVEGCAQLIRHTPGIHVWQSGDNKVTRNLVRDLPYSGIIVSGVGEHFFNGKEGAAREMKRTIRWGEVPEGREYTRESIQPFLHARNNLVEGNEITKVLTELGDGNGIYIRFASETGNVIRGNYVHHIDQVRAAGGIRCDGGQHGVTVEGNFIHRVPMTGISSNGRNTLRNNFLVDVFNAGNAPPAARPYVREYILLWNDTVAGSDISRNIFLDTGNGTPAFFYLTHAKWLGPTPPVLEDLALAGNLYWVRGNPSWTENFVADLHRRNLDPGSVAVDPGMKTAPDGRVTFDSAVLARQQIKPFDWDAVGLPEGTNLD